MNFKAIILTFLTCLSFCQISAEKHGMIIAVGAYPSEGRWPSISSQNDVHHIQNALMAIGFKKDNISGIYDADATRDGIIQALEQLESRLSYGDIVYIHFSGHGQQVWDDNSDELDNLDEVKPTNFDLLILDYHMPTLTGLEVIKKCMPKYK